MQSENRILGNQLVVMSREDLDALVNEMAQNIVAAQTKNAQNDLETWMNVPEGERFITREEAAHNSKSHFTEVSEVNLKKNHKNPVIRQETRDKIVKEWNNVILKKP